ncbi:MAG: hypothetical protein H7Y89_12630, partial [Steroidobacteraceae bacterium]|nr:hypothetical protein [Steroidobacteraceae bacterium]
AAAQARLEAAIDRRLEARAVRRPARRVGGWLAAATSAAAVALVVLMLPLTPTPAIAFSQIQAHFRDFRTLRFDMTQSATGQETFAMRVSVTRDGKVRTDIGEDMSVVVNPVERRMLTIVHRERIAVEAPFEGAPEAGDGLEWLQEVRDFQGIATRLPDSRVIDGRLAYGWQLLAATVELELWATEDGLPLQMKMKGAGDVRFDFRFEFDVAFAPEVFSTAIPAGYSRGNAED